MVLWFSLILCGKPVGLLVLVTRGWRWGSPGVSPSASEWGCELLHIGWISHKVLRYSTGNHNGKEYNDKYAYKTEYMCVKVASVMSDSL